MATPIETLNDSIVNKLTLNIFTNCTEHNSKDNRLIKSSYESLIGCFPILDKVNINIFIDRKPREENFDEYAAHIKTYFDELGKIFTIHETDGLADAYIKSTETACSKYLFQLEHDWTFISKNINHSLSEIVHAMELKELHHLRFNKRANAPVNCDKWHFREVIIGGMRLCRTKCRSNNPHIIDRQAYIDKYNRQILRDNRMTRSYGVEEAFWKREFGYIYGGRYHPETIKHLDGKTLFT